MPFIVYALPRSRTAWLAQFLTYGKYICQHEYAQYLRDITDIRHFFSYPHLGSVETAAAPGRDIIRHICPSIKEVVILRPVEEVVESLMKIDFGGMACYNRLVLEKGMRYCDRVLRKIAITPGVLVAQYHDLDKPEICAQIFEYCLPYEFDFEWWESLRSKNIQEEHVKMVQYRLKNRDSIMRFKSVCKSELRRLYRFGLLPRKVMA